VSIIEILPSATWFARGFACGCFFLGVGLAFLAQLER